MSHTVTPCNKLKSINYKNSAYSQIRIGCMISNKLKSYCYENIHQQMSQLFIPFSKSDAYT